MARLSGSRGRLVGLLFGLFAGVSGSVVPVEGHGRGKADRPGSRMNASSASLNRLASPARFELATPGLGNRCSIQLSYGDDATPEARERLGGSPKDSRRTVTGA